MTADVVTVLVADDHPLYRRGLAALLDAQEGWSVVAQAEDGLAAVTEAHAHEPDVVVMDLNMPKVDGIEATRRIVSASPRVGVLVLTMYDDDESVFAAMRAGARGYVLKGADQSDIVRAVAAVARGEAILARAWLSGSWNSSPTRGGLSTRTSSRSSANVSARCSTSSRPGVTTRRSRRRWASARRRCAITCRTSSRNSRSPIERRPSCGPETPGLGADLGLVSGRG